MVPTTYHLPPTTYYLLPTTYHLLLLLLLLPTAAAATTTAALLNLTLHNRLNTKMICLSLEIEKLVFRFFRRVEGVFSLPYKTL